MANKQLESVADWERNKEQKRAQDFRLAQQNVSANQQKLSGLEQYRLEYLRQVQTKASAGLDAKHFNQHQSFIGKLDKACEQQTQVLNNAKQVAEQRKALWLQQQRRRQAVEHLIAKKQAEQDVRLNRQEQQMLDELALQKFVMRKANRTHPGK